MQIRGETAPQRSRRDNVSLHGGGRLVEKKDLNEKRRGMFSTRSQFSLSVSSRELFGLLIELMGVLESL
jgi:hypothetical protein